MAAHTLKGSARAVGAWPLATIAEDAERMRGLPPATARAAVDSSRLEEAASRCDAISSPRCPASADLRRTASPACNGLNLLAAPTIGAEQTTAGSRRPCPAADRAPASPRGSRAHEMAKITFIQPDGSEPDGRGRARRDRHGSRQAQRRPRHRGRMRRRLRLRNVPRLRRRCLAREDRQAGRDGRGYARLRLRRARGEPPELPDQGDAGASTASSCACRRSSSETSGAKGSGMSSESQLGTSAGGCPIETDAVIIGAGPVRPVRRVRARPRRHQGARRRHPRQAAAASAPSSIPRSRSTTSRACPSSPARS